MNDFKVYSIFFLSSDLNAFMEVIRSNYPSKVVADNFILIYTNDDTKEIYEKIEAHVNRTLITEIGGTFRGKLVADVWEWLDGKAGKMEYGDNYKG